MVQRESLAILRADDLHRALTPQTTSGQENIYFQEATTVSMQPSSPAQPAVPGDDCGDCQSSEVGKPSGIAARRRYIRRISSFDSTLTIRRATRRATGCSSLPVWSYSFSRGSGQNHRRTTGKFPSASGNGRSECSSPTLPSSINNT